MTSPPDGPHQGSGPASSPDPRELYELECLHLRDIQPEDLKFQLEEYTESLREARAGRAAGDPAATSDILQVDTTHFVRVLHALWMSALRLNAPHLGNVLLDSAIDWLKRARTELGPSQPIDILAIDQPASFLFIAMSAAAIKADKPDFATMPLDIRSDSIVGAERVKDSMFYRLVQIRALKHGLMGGHSWADQAFKEFSPHLKDVDGFEDDTERRACYLAAELLYSARVALNLSLDVGEASLGSFAIPGHQMEEWEEQMLKAPEPWFGTSNQSLLSWCFEALDRLSRQYRLTLLGITAHKPLEAHCNRHSPRQAIAASPELRNRCPGVE